jgi:hypothetical protein
VSLERFTRRERRVRLGGRSLGIGRFRLHLGGGWYTVGPLSVLKVYQLHQAQMKAAVIFRDPAGFMALAKTAPVAFLRVFAPLLVRDPIAPRHLARTSARQLLTLTAAVEQTTDFAYIDKTLTPREGKRGSAGFDVWIVSACQILNRHLEDLVHLPFEQVAWHLEILGRLNEQQKPVSERAPHELDADEIAELNRKLAAFGVEVADA